jgi:hypothetical protein
MQSIFRLAGSVAQKCGVETSTSRNRDADASYGEGHGRVELSRIVVQAVSYSGLASSEAAVTRWVRHSHSALLLLPQRCTKEDPILPTIKLDPRAFKMGIAATPYRLAVRLTIATCAPVKNQSRTKNCRQHHSTNPSSSLLKLQIASLMSRITSSARKRPRSIAVRPQSYGCRLRRFMPLSSDSSRLFPT